MKAVDDIAAVGGKGNDWMGIGWTGIGWTGIGWTGNGWTGKGWMGNDWMGNDWMGNDWTGMLPCGDAYATLRFGMMTLLMGSFGVYIGPVAWATPCVDCLGMGWLVTGRLVTGRLVTGMGPILLEEESMGIFFLVMLAGHLGLSLQPMHLQDGPQVHGNPYFLPHPAMKSFTCLSRSSKASNMRLFI